MNYENLLSIYFGKKLWTYMNYGTSGMVDISVIQEIVIPMIQNKKWRSIKLNYKITLKRETSEAVAKQNIESAQTRENQ